MSTNAAESPQNAPPQPKKKKRRKKSDKKMELDDLKREVEMVSAGLIVTCS